MEVSVRGMRVDPRTNYLFAAGCFNDNAFVYDADTGAQVMEYQLNLSGEFGIINDLTITEDAVYFTDSFRPVMYRLPLGSGGAIAGAPVEIPLGGDFVQVPSFNSNGIEASANGKWLIIVHSVRGELYRVDPASGDATLIDLGGGAVFSGDGILLRGHTLYVVQNFMNQVAVVELSPNFTSGSVVATLTDSNFDRTIPARVPSGLPPGGLIGSR